MANGNGSWNLQAVALVLSILVVIVGAAITFANKIDRSEIIICVDKIEKKISDGDNKLDQKVDAVELEVKRLIESNQREIVNLIKSLADKN